MSKNRRKRTRAQVKKVEEQLRLPLVEALVDIRADFLEIVHTSGMKVVEAMLEEDRIALVGPKHARDSNREMVRAGTVPGELVLGGRKVGIRRPRVRRLGSEGGEVPLHTYEALSSVDPLSRRMMEQMLIGVSTRKYDRSLEPLPPETKSRSTSKSSVSRRFVARTEAELKAWQKRSLADLDIVALMVDGIGFGDHTLVVALGIDSSGKKHPLGMREGTTENGSVCKALLRDVVDRGVPADRTILVVIDGGGGLRKAVKAVFGQYALIQRCQVHKRRNVLDHLPDHLRPNAKRVLDQAYNAKSTEVAKKQLEHLAKSLEKAHPGAAASIREGLDETLTVIGLGLGPSLRRSLSTTNAIESTFATVRRVSRRVTRWPSGTMALRWALAGIREAEKKYRRLMGSKTDMPKLITALRRLDVERPSESRRTGS